MSFPFVLKTFDNRPTDGYVLTWSDDDTSWIASPATGGGGGGFTAGGDLSGTSVSQTVLKLHGNPIDAISNSVLQDGYVLTWSNSGNKYSAVPVSATVSINMAGDVTGTTTTSVVEKINGASVPSSSLASTNHLLKVSGTSALAYGYLVNANVDAAAAIAYSKLALTGTILNADINASAGIVYSKLALTGTILNADINASAGIVYSKLALTGSILNADVNASAGIVYSKLALSNTIVNADVNTAAAIAYSKLALTGSIVNADISGSAVIDVSKLAAGTDGYVISTVAGVPTWTIQVPRQYEISLQTGLASTTRTAVFTRAGARQIDMTPYPATVGALTRTVKFVANIDKTSGATNCEVQLYDTTHTVIIAGTPLTSTSNSNAAVSATLTVGSSSTNFRNDIATEYEVQFRMNGGGGSDAVFITNARIIITYA